MFIANFDDFNQYMDSLFAQNSIKDFASYRQALVESKVKRKAKIADISKEINKLLKQIETARTKIKQATAAEDKKVCGLALNTYISAKQELVKQYNRQKNATLFSELSDNAKIYACSKNLLLKYLPPEFNKLPYLNMPKDEQGNLIFKADQLQDTPLDRDINHIIDYVTSYIENYPENVRGAKHFTGLHKQCSDLKELVEQVDAYFAKLNSPKEKEANRIKKSHSGFEVVMTMPQYGLQAVRLLNKSALQYEGSAMHHCVGSYAARVEKGETAIYSMRLTANETHEMIPVATIEYKDGKIRQIKGPHDKEISFAYLQGARDFILHLTGKKDIAEIASDDTVGDKQNIGLIKDNKGVYRDIYTLIEDENYCFDNIHIEASSLSHIPTNHLSVKTLTIHGKLKNDDLKYLSAINVQSTLAFNELDFEGKHLDLSGFSNTDIRLDFSHTPNLETVTLSDNVEDLRLNGAFPHLNKIRLPSHLEKLDMSGSFGLKELTLPDKVKSFSYEDEANKYIPIKLNSALQELDLNGKIKLNDMLTSLPNLIKLNLDGADISDITSLNLPHICPKLQELNMMDCKMANLRELIAPSDTGYLNMNQSEFPSLEKLDFSAMQLKTFGQIDSNLMGSITISTLPQSMRENIEVDNNNRVLNPMRLRGVVLQEAKLPNLKEIKYPQDVEVIDFALNHFNLYDIVDFKAYPNLRTIETPDLKIIDMTDKKVVDKPQSNIQGVMIYQNRLITRS